MNKHLHQLIYSKILSTLKYHPYWTTIKISLVIHRMQARLIETALLHRTRLSRVGKDWKCFSYLKETAPSRAANTYFLRIFKFAPRMGFHRVCKRQLHRKLLGPESFRIQTLLQILIIKNNLQNVDFISIKSCYSSFKAIPHRKV